MPVAFVRLAIFFCAGIVLGQYIPLSPATLLVVMLVALGAFALCVLTRQKSLVVGGLLTFFLMSLGSWHHKQFTARFKLHVHPEGVKSILLKMNTIKSTGINKKRAEANIVASCSKDGVWKKESAKAMVYFKDLTKDQLLISGDLILTNANINELKGPQNPGAFDFRKYLFNKGVKYQLYLDSTSFVKKNNTTTNSWQLSRLQQKIADEINQVLLKNKSGPILSAMLLGDRRALNSELKNEFIQSGVMHVLAISGLHVGILFWVLNLITSFLKRWKYGKLLQLLLIMGSLLFYCLLSGAGPSVLRATFMLSLIGVGKYLMKNTSTMNLLATTAFVMLLIDPCMLFNVGFQLSFLAVSGIVLVYPQIYNRIKIKYRVLDYFWQLIAVSLAVQLFTAPISVYYFHQFPTYFLLSNIVVIPMAFVLLLLGLILLVLMWSHELTSLVVHLIEWLSGQLVSFLAWINQLPYAKIEGISSSLLEVLVAYILIAGVVFLFPKKHVHRYLSIAILGLLLIGLRTGRFYWHSNQEILTVYKYKKETIISVIKGRSSGLIGIENKVNTRNNMFPYEAHLVNRGCQGTPIRFISKTSKAGNLLTVVDGKVICCYQHRETLPFHIDYLIIGNNVIKQVEDLQRFEVGEVVFDGSNSWYLCENLKTKVSKLNCEVFFVPLSGAFVRDDFGE